MSSLHDEPLSDAPINHDTPSGSRGIKRPKLTNDSSAERGDYDWTWGYGNHVEADDFARSRYWCCSPCLHPIGGRALAKVVLLPHNNLASAASHLLNVHRIPVPVPPSASVPAETPTRGPSSLLAAEDARKRRRSSNAAQNHVRASTEVQVVQETPPPRRTSVLAPPTPRPSQSTSSVASAVETTAVPLDEMGFPRIETTRLALPNASATLAESEEQGARSALRDLLAAELARSERSHTHSTSAEESSEDEGEGEGEGHGDGDGEGEVDGVGEGEGEEVRTAAGEGDGEPSVYKMEDTEPMGFTSLNQVQASSAQNRDEDADSEIGISHERSASGHAPLQEKRVARALERIEAVWGVAWPEKLYEDPGMRTTGWDNSAVLLRMAIYAELVPNILWAREALRLCMEERISRRRGHKRRIYMKPDVDNAIKLYENKSTRDEVWAIVTQKEKAKQAA